MFRIHAVIVTPLAESDLQGIYAYHAADSGPVADLVYGELYKSILSLGQLPQRFQLAKDRRLRRQGIRSVAVVSYRIYYIVEERAVRILCVWHLARRMPRHRLK